MISTLWEVEVTKAEIILKILSNNALLLSGIPVTIGQQTWNSYRIHDLLHDLAINWLTAKISPGLGLTISKAHSILLERYQNNLEDGKWHKLTDDGYIHNHLTWHMKKATWTQQMHQLLNEETEEGHNGWYQASDNLGQTDRYITDIAHAWELAKKIFDDFPTESIALQCQYALMTASVNSLANNIPVDLVVALVENNQWTPDKGVAYAKQMPEIQERFQALKGLNSLPRSLKQKKPDIFSSIQQELHKIQKQIDKFTSNKTPTEKQSSPISDLPKLLSLEEFQQALNQISKIGENPREQVLKISQLIHSLVNLSFSSKSKQEALQLIFNYVIRIRGDNSRASGLIGLAPHIYKASLQQQLLDSAQKIYDPLGRSRVLTKLIKLIPNLSDSIKLKTLQEAEDAALNIKDEWSQNNALTKLIIMLPDSSEKNILIEKAFEKILDQQYLKSKKTRSNAIIQFIPHIPKDFRKQAFQKIVNIQDSWERERILIKLISYLPDDLKIQALDIALKIKEPKIKAEALLNLISYLPDSFNKNKIFHDIFTAIQNIQNDVTKKEILKKLKTLINDLSISLVQETINGVLTIENSMTQAETFIELASGAKKNLKQRLLELAENAALEILDPISQARIKIKIAKEFPPQQKQILLIQALEFMELILVQTCMVIITAKEFSPQQQILLTQSLELAELVVSQTWMKIEIAKEFSAEEEKQTILNQALKLVECLDPMNQARIKIEIAKEFPAEEEKQAILNQAINSALKIQQIWYRMQTLTEIVQKLSLDEKNSARVWHQIVNQSFYTRENLLVNISSITPLIFNLGGTKAILKIIDVIKKVEQWWP